LTVNRIKDFIDRVGWTAIQAALGVLLDQMTTGEISWRAIAWAAAFAAVKVAAAQNFGRHPDGAAIPGGVLEAKPKRRRKPTAA
jgi:hypothetical protein